MLWGAEVWHLLGQKKSGICMGVRVSVIVCSFMWQVQCFWGCIHTFFMIYRHLLHALDPRHHIALPHYWSSSGLQQRILLEVSENIPFLPHFIVRWCFHVPLVFFCSSLVGVITFTFCGAVSYRPTARSQPAAALNINALLWFIHAFDGQFSWLRCQPAFRPYACLCCCLGLFLLLSSFFYRIFIEKKLINYEYLCAVRLVTQGDRHTKW